MKSSLLKSPVLLNLPKNLSVLLPKIKGSGEMKKKEHSLFAKFSDTNIEKVASCIFEGFAEYSSDIHLQFTKNSKQMIFFRMEHFEKADIQIKIHAENNAEVFFIFLVKNEIESKLQLQISGTIDANATLHAIGLHMNEGDFLGEFSIDMDTNAHSFISIIEIGKGSGKSDIQIENRATHSFAVGEIKTRAMLFENSSSQIQGVPVVKMGAENCENHLDQKTLLLSEKAHSKSIPLLSIANNWVSASHKSSIARLTDDDLFYFQSRGVSKQSAQKLLLEGFLTEIFTEIPEEGIQKCMSELAQHFLEKE